ncbi:MAG: hypothetical protein NT067_01145 [Candidatus Diapherotrites archaeon]|nr:hypothetical protein [Candidatus Diapherotrites archaeon]
MEMPIWAMITLMIAVLVGTMVFLFGQQWLRAAGVSIGEVVDSSGEADRLIWQPATSSGQIASMIESCYAGSVGKKLERGVCFAMAVDTPFAVSSAQITPLVKNVDPKKFRIYDGTTYSVMVVYDYVNGIVEVRS